MLLGSPCAQPSAPAPAPAPAPSHLRPLDAMTHGRFADVAAAQGPEGGDVGRGCGGGWEGGPRKIVGLVMNFPGTAAAADLAAVSSSRPRC